MGPICPNSESLREANDCHTPAGSAQGGQFCSKDGGVSTKSAAFKAWFGDSKIVNSKGNPLRLYHGTLGNFDTFEPGTIESDMGAGIYFTDTPEDANWNYSTINGPDVRVRFQDAQQRIADALSGGDENTKERVQEWLADHPGRTEEDAADALAREEIRAAHGGATIPAYLRMERPAVISNPWEPGTFLDFDQPQDEDGNFTGEPTGKLVDFINGLKSAASDFDNVDADGAAESLWSLALDSDGVTLGDAITHLRQSQELQNAEDRSTGKLASTEIIRRALEHMGFDGVIDKTVSKKWQMAGMHPTTKHYIVFHPSQIKSALGNRGTYSRKSNRITEALREFNPCHSQFDGRFTSVNKDGRCQGAAAQWRKREAGRIRDGRRIQRGGPEDDLTSSVADTLNAEDVLHAAVYNARVRVGARAALAGRQTARKGPYGRIHEPLPGYLRADAERGFEQDRAVTLLRKGEDNPHAHAGSREIRIAPEGTARDFSRPETLTVLRHELGHVNPRKINSAMVAGLQPSTLRDFALMNGASDMDAQKASRKMVEEVRAWRNAIRDSDGRISTRVLRAGLTSHATSKFGPIFGPDIADAAITTLERYRRRVKRAGRRAS